MCSCWWQWKSVSPGLSAIKSTSASWYPPIDVLAAEFTDCPICLPIVNAPHESEQSTLGKGRLHAHCREHARKRRGARAATRNHKRAKGARPRMWRWHDGIARGETRSGGAGRRYREQPGGGWE